MLRTGYCMGLGVDIVNISRFTRLLEGKNNEFVGRLSSRILHPLNEMPKFKDLQVDSPHRCASFIAGSWAAKEALYKTLDHDSQRTFEFRSWYRDHDSNGKPTIKNDNHPKRDEEFLLSISHDNDMLIATVLRQQVYEIPNFIKST